MSVRSNARGPVTVRVVFDEHVLELARAGGCCGAPAVAAKSSAQLNLNIVSEL